MNKIESFVSVVLPFRDNVEIVAKSVPPLHKLLDDQFTDYEIVLVDNASNSRNDEIIGKLLSKFTSIRALILTESVSTEIACYAGLENSIGDVSIIFDPLLDPIEIIPELVLKVRSGNDVVVGCTSIKKTISYKIAASLFRKYFADFLAYKVPKDATMLRAISRRALNSILSRNRHIHHFFMDISNSGYTDDIFEYSRKKNSKEFIDNSLRNGFRNFLSILVFNSTKPLRLINMLGLLGSCFAILISLYVFVVNLLKTNVAEGWTTLTLFTSIQFFIMFMVMFLFGEYIARLVDEGKECEPYSILSEKHSSVMLNQDRWNVLTESESDDKNLTQTGRDR